MKQMKLTESFLQQQEDNFYESKYKKKDKKVNFMLQSSDASSVHDFQIKKYQNKIQREFSGINKRQNYTTLKQQDQHQNQNQIKKSQKVSSALLINCLYSYIKKVKVLPTILVEQLQKREKKYDSQNQSIYYPFAPKDMNFCVKTRTGRQGVRNLIGFLQDLQSKQSNGLAQKVYVQWSFELHQAASKRANAIKQGDSYTESLDIGELVSQFASWKGPLSEIIVYGFFDPKQILMEAFLEDDSPNNNNRNQFFNEGGRYVGIDMAEHKKYRFVTVIIFAGGVGKIDNNKKTRAFMSDREVNEHCQCNIC